MKKVKIRMVLSFTSSDRSLANFVHNPTWIFGFRPTREPNGSDSPGLADGKSRNIDTAAADAVEGSVSFVPSLLLSSVI